jgi:hypothetical protein
MAAPATQRTTCLLDFTSQARGLLVPIRWRGGDESRPSLLPYDVATRRLSALFGDELDALIAILVQSNAPACAPSALMPRA